MQEVTAPPTGWEAASLGALALGYGISGLQRLRRFPSWESISYILSFPG